MELITSVHNEWVAEARKLQQKKYRELNGLFLVEGVRLAEEAAKAATVQEVYYHEALGDTDRGADLLKVLSSKTQRFFKVTAKVMQSLAETASPQGVVCVCKSNAAALKDFDLQEGVVLIADGIQDPGNLGAILRTLWAAGGAGMVCMPGTTDPYGGKCVRASMGGIFNLPVFCGLPWASVAKWAGAQGFSVIAADSGGGEDYRSMVWPGKTLLCIGNEGAGLASVPEEDVDRRVTIPLAQGADSLNAAVAAGILIFQSMSGMAR